jgi:Tol biopolymer transport system component
MNRKIFLLTPFICLIGLASFTVSWENENKIESSLEIFTLATNERQVVYLAAQHFEAPNWSRDGSFLIYNSQGKIYRIPCIGGTPTLVNTEFATKCNNDHGISPNGKQLVISHHESTSGKSMIYTLPITGGTPTLVTANAPSYWHGWSPDGRTLAYCAERNGEFDIYKIPTEGGTETRLTNAKGLDDGPDYSPDGQYIYFNSTRTGKMKIWKMKSDGSDQQQVTFDEYNDWFAHPSPDGKWVVFVSYEADVEGHPANKNVLLRLMPLKGGPIKILAKLFGGQGTINVPSWSPDSKQFAFVSYKLLNE